MKKGFNIFNIALFLFLFLSGILMLSYSNSNNDVSQKLISNSTLTFKCLKCHKGSKSLPNMVKKKNIKSAKELKFLIRKGPKSGLHITVPDEDLEKAIKYLNLSQ